jgi:hypothetical protein
MKTIARPQKAVLSLVLISVFCVGTSAWAKDKAFHATRHAVIRCASGAKIKVDIADTPKEREEGLMFRKKLPKDYGMLFVFPREDYFEFWMKNTWVNLDMVYIGWDKKITALYPNVAASTPKTKDEDVARVGGRAQYVLELPAGAAKRDHLAVGQDLRFKTKIPRT